MTDTPEVPTPDKILLEVERLQPYDYEKIGADLDLLLEGDPDLHREQIKTPLDWGTLPELSQEQVSSYFMGGQPDVEGSIAWRRRNLEQPSYARSVITLVAPVPVSRRHSREDGLTRPSVEWQESMLIAARVLLAGPSELRVFVAATDEWNRDHGLPTIPGTTLEEKATNYAAAVFKTPLSEIQPPVNGSVSGYMLKQDEHMRPHSLLGKMQMPIHVAEHWAKHNERTQIAGKLLVKLYDLKYKVGVLTTTGPQNAEDHQFLARYGNVDFDSLIELTSASFIIDASASRELMPNSAPLRDSLGKKQLARTRSKIAASAGKLEYEQVASQVNDKASILKPSQWGTIQRFSREVASAHGALSPERIITEDERTAIENLGILAFREEKSFAAARLQNCLGSVSEDFQYGEHGIAISGLVNRLRQDPIQQWSKEYLDENPAEKDALLALQNALNEDILIDIVPSPKRNGIRVSWDVQLATVIRPGEKIPLKFDPYDGRMLRRLHDVLSTAHYDSILPHGGPPRGHELTKAELDVVPGLDMEVRPDLTVERRILAEVENEAIAAYLETHGITDREEVLRLLNPSRFDEEPPSALQNVDIAAGKIDEWIEEGKQIASVGDCDQDGAFASVIENMLEKLGAKELLQFVHARLQGHSLRSVDLLNLRLQGAEAFLINDTGSSVEDVRVFRILHDGIANEGVINDFNVAKAIYQSAVEQSKTMADSSAFLQKAREQYESSVEAALLGFYEFGKFIDEVDGIGSIKGVKIGNIRSKITRFTNDFKKELIQDFTESDLTIEFLKAKVTELLDSPVMAGSSVHMKDVPGFAKYAEGDKSIEFVVMDHHTASLQGVEYFSGIKYGVMVNPQWIRNDKRDVFLQEMREALAANDPIRVKDVQRRYECYDGDLVGTVVVAKVLRRVMELQGEHPLLHVNADHLFQLPSEEKNAKLQELSAKVSAQVCSRSRGMLIYTGSESDYEYAIAGPAGVELSINLRNVLPQRGGLGSAINRITGAHDALIRNLADAVERFGEEHEMESAAVLQHVLSAKVGFEETTLFDRVIDNFEIRWDVRVNNREILRAQFMQNGLEHGFPQHHAHAAVRNLERLYQETVLEGTFLNDAEKRFYLAHNQILPESYHSMGWEEKAEYVSSQGRRIIRELQFLTIDVEDGTDVSIDLSAFMEEKQALQEVLTIDEIRQQLTLLVEAAFEQHGATNPTGRVAKLPTCVKNEVNRLYNEAFDNVRFSIYEQEVLENYEQFGLWGLDQIRIIEAIAQVGDGGSVVQPETRYITRNGFETAQAWVDMVRLNPVPASVQKYLRSKFHGKDYDEALAKWKSDRKSLFDNVEPPIIDIMRASLEGERLSGVNLLLTRGHTHTWGSAMMNGFNRAFAVKGREPEARKLLREYVKLYSTGKLQQTHSQRLLRAELPDVHKSAIAAREKLWANVVKEVESRPNWRSQRVLVVGVSGDINDPTGGLRGLIAGELAARYKDKVIIVYDIQKQGSASSETPSIVGLSGRLPSDGNLELDMAFRQIEYNSPNPDRVRVLACGGHPCAAGAKVSVVLNPEDSDSSIQSELEKVLIPLLQNYIPTNRDRGIVSVDRIIDRALNRLQEQGFMDVQAYREYINSFELVQNLAEVSYKILDPYGSDLENLRMRIDNVRVVAISKGRKNDDTPYTYLHVEDGNKHVMKLRVFPDEVDLQHIRTGDVLALTVEGRVRRRPIGVSKMTRRRPWSLPKRAGHPKYIETEYWASEKSIPRLYITEVEKSTSEI